MPPGRWGLRKKHPVRLTDAPRADSAARFAGPITLRPRDRVPVPVPLRADAGETDADLADDPGISARAAAAVRERCAADGRDAARTEKPRAGGPAVLDGTAEAVLIGRACSPVPDARTTRTARPPASGPLRCSDATLLPFRFPGSGNRGTFQPPTPPL